MPDCAQAKEEAAPHSKRRKRNGNFEDGSSISMYVYSRGGPQPAPALRPSLFYCALAALVRGRRRKNADYYHYTKGHGQW
jgi:hypothetical protein